MTQPNEDVEDPRCTGSFVLVFSLSSTDVYFNLYFCSINFVSLSLILVCPENATVYWNKSSIMFKEFEIISQQYRDRIPGCFQAFTHSCDSLHIWLHQCDYWVTYTRDLLIYSNHFPARMSFAPQILSKTMIKIATPHISTFDLSPPEWKLHTGVERSNVEEAIPLFNSMLVNLIF